MNQEKLFSNTRLKNKTFKNRCVVAPMTRISAEEDGRANETMKKYYERYAKGGFSAIITEGIYLDERYSQGYNDQPGLVREDHVQAWKPVVDAVHKHDSLILAQLMHAGGQSQGNAYTNETISPSDIPPKGEQLGFYGGSGPFQTPKAMTEQDIEQVKDAFAQSAIRAKEAGFDGIEIHGANGYLLDQFLTDYLNRREDPYGGSKENRLQIILESIQNIREAVGSDYIVGIRISQIKVADPDHKWAEGEKEAEYIFSQLGQTSLDYIHVTDGDATHPAFGEDSRTLAQAARDYGKLPVIANGKLGDPDKAEKLLKDEYADFISLGTSALANPDLPNKVKKGMELNDFNFEKILLPQAKVKDLELQMEIVQ
ncbi:NADH oxidase [Halobacillus karajensis]|uniref:NADH oxidase n=1 Tax=Halobacillus karajensis TaxID=195088 RepID=A0A024P525_9BACI|nr:NADH:flavin oxidoreductase [Halobacillus karajensis]CDQ20804.1 NADH oxidase [Halobacillus karajensis]CDQ23726.1 NADH oxidase [Halobacillus karajensis]CDQ27204.1 NADH oxidase [Halobacillus karajensis]